MIHKVSALSEHDHARMFTLMTSHYENVKHEKFLHDLAEKDGVLLLYDETGEIQGFTTFLLMEFAFTANQRMPCILAIRLSTRPVGGRWNYFVCLVDCLKYSLLTGRSLYIGFY